MDVTEYNRTLLATVEATEATIDLRRISAELQVIANKWLKAPADLIDRKNKATRRYLTARRAYYAATGESWNLPG